MNSNSGIDRLDRIRERLRTFSAERDWNRFHDPKNLAMAIVSEAGELAAELRWVANTAADDFVKDEAIRVRLEREIGDVAIALILLCDRAGIDFFSAVEQKIDLNARNYPADLVIGTADRPKYAADGEGRQAPSVAP